MKVKILIVYSFITAITCNIYAQKDSIHSMPFYWTYELSSSYLMSTGIIKNHSAPLLPTASGSLYFNWNFSLRSNQPKDMQGFFIAPGVGIGFGTYSIDKSLSESNGNLIISDIEGAYKYCYVQGVYLDIPIDLRYFTHPNAKQQNFYFELGGKFGTLVSTKKEIASSQGDEYYTHTTKNVGIMNKYRHGINTKIGIRKIKINKQNDTFGFAFSIITNYYVSDAFKYQDISPSESISVGVGLGLLFR